MQRSVAITYVKSMGQLCSKQNICEVKKQTYLNIYWSQNKLKLQQYNKLTECLSDLDQFNWERESKVDPNTEELVK